MQSLENWMNLNIPWTYDWFARTTMESQGEHSTMTVFTWTDFLLKTVSRHTNQTWRPCEFPCGSAMVLVRISSFEFNVTFINILYLYGGTLWHLLKFLQYIIMMFTSSIILLYPPSFHSWNSFYSSHFSIYLHKYIIFPPHSPSFTLHLYPPLSNRCHPQDRNFFAFLSFMVVKRHFCWCKLVKPEFPCDITMFACIINGSSPLIFSFLSYSPSHGDFNRF
jgi:hypothetical protein